MITRISYLSTWKAEMERLHRQAQYKLRTTILDSDF